ncbi:hypothetical protein V1227_04395 [Lentzea sp. DG1S-22]|uniref:hypothetical protein n=1 Tax=Lentzea sp. DG1S-22 TaxID=3108822 RepID=UPI002E7A727B|nr:hypothetical protein [Lentzea sp. DG1S-22]WVH81999.1 hypothetical protein V1227_04395 [Lentzea sp. DG1S-22]
MKSTVAFMVSVAVLGFSSGALVEGFLADSGKGARFGAEWSGAEWKMLPALDPDYEVVQLTTSKALDDKS